jgi:Family of unknown function (DUF6350)
VSYGLIAIPAVAGSWGHPASGLRLAAVGWLLGHGVGVSTPTDQITLAPLSITVLVMWRVVRAGVHASRAVGGHRHRAPQRALAAAGAVTLAYAGLGAGVAAVVNGHDLAVSPMRAGASFALLGGACAGFGAVRRSRSGRRWLRQIPDGVASAVRAAVAAAGLVLAAGAAGAGVSLALRGSEAAGMLGSYHTGVIGQAGITLLCLTYLPNLAVWGAAYLLGPGFSVGVDTTISTGAVVLGPLPALPPLAALPSAPSAATPALLAVPLLAAAYAGWSLARTPTRRSTPAGEGRSLSALIAAAVLAGPMAGALLQVVGWASAGGLGSGRLAVMGPTGWQMGLVAAAVVALGCTLGVAGARLVATRRGVP